MIFEDLLKGNINLLSPLGQDARSVVCAKCTTTSVDYSQIYSA